MSSNKDILNRILEAMKEHGIRVDVHKAKTTSSIYLVFDNGMLKRARIGDHKGKGYHYTYEIGDHIFKLEAISTPYEHGDFIRYRYPANAVEDMIMQILVMRLEKMKQFGTEYHNAMEAWS